jgi:anaerobic selenocysteine-containing dehydrogenase
MKNDSLQAVVSTPMKRRDFFKHALAGAAVTTVGASLGNYLSAAAVEPNKLALELS